VVYLDQIFLEQDLNDFLEDGQEPRMVHPHTALQHRQQCTHLQQMTANLAPAVNDNVSTLLGLEGVSVKARDINPES
jgi:hypothetical protein